MGFKNLPPAVLGLFGIIFGALVLGSVVTWALKRFKPEKNWNELSQRVKTWWMMAGIFITAMAVHRAVSIVFFAFISFLALKEFFSLVPQRRADRRVLFWAFISIPFQYYWVWIEWYGMFIVFIPVYAFLFMPMRMVIIGETAGFLRAVSMIHWGLMTTVFCLSHIAYLLVTPLKENPQGGGPGLVLFLVMLTQLNDVMQYMWGRLFGRHKIIPKVSPGKTWEGFIGGFVSTIILSVLLARWVTPLPVFHSIMAGMLISGSGFIGDVTISALKRDLGVKDSGSMLPGHGGILDRIDSQIYTAPLFFHFVRYFHFS